MNRRQFLSRMLKTGYGILLAYLPLPVYGAWPTKLFASQTFEQVLEQLTLGQPLHHSDRLQLHLHENAEDGASVPMQIQSDIPNVMNIQVLVEKNPTPLILQWQLQAGVIPFLSIRIKMAESSNVWLITEVDGVWWFNKRWVNVMKGGCGTG